MRTPGRHFFKKNIRNFLRSHGVPKKLRTPCQRSGNAAWCRLISEIWFSLFELHHTNMLFCISETKSATQPNAYMYVFATLKKKQKLCFLNPKFKAVFDLIFQLLNRPVWVRTGRKPRDMFSILHSRES